MIFPALESFAALATLRVCLILCWWWCLVLAAQGKFIAPDIEHVPTERLITNLTQRVQANPKDLQARYSLARVHSIGYAQNQAQFEVLKQTGLPYFGPEPSDRGAPPAQVATRSDPTQTQLAGQHLTNAIRWYREAIALDDRHLPSQLGLGWCLDQADEKASAKTAYRRALALAWADERGREGLYAGLSVTEEVARYLLPLLDPAAEAGEIETVRRYADTVQKKPRFITPILMPLEDHLCVADLIRPEAAVAFDLDGSGQRRRWGWPSPRAGWLVHDPASTGRITSGLQLFGSVTFWVFWPNGYAALASLDNDSDGYLRGEELAGLAVWRDANQDGFSDPGEVQPLSRWGVEALACSGEPKPGVGWWHRAGMILSGGRTRPTYDWLVQDL